MLQMELEITGLKLKFSSDGHERAARTGIAIVDAMIPAQAESRALPAPAPVETPAPAVLASSPAPEAAPAGAAAASGPIEQKAEQSSPAAPAVPPAEPVRKSAWARRYPKGSAPVKTKMAKMGAGWTPRAAGNGGGGAGAGLAFASGRKLRKDSWILLCQEKPGRKLTMQMAMELVGYSTNTPFCKAIHKAQESGEEWAQVGEFHFARWDPADDEPRDGATPIDPGLHGRAAEITHGEKPTPADVAAGPI